MEIVYQKDRGVKLTPVVKGKSEKVKTREIKKLMQQFPHVEERVIRVVYGNSKCDLSEAANALADMAQPPETVTYSFLFDMFPGLDKEYIGEVYEGCGADLSKATAFILQTTCPEVSEETELTEESGFGNANIGFVNSEALTKRLNADYLAQLAGIFPTVDEDQIAAVLSANQGELFPTIQELELQFGNKDESPTREPQPPVLPVPSKK